MEISSPRSTRNGWVFSDVPQKNTLGHSYGHISDISDIPIHGDIPMIYHMSGLFYHSSFTMCFEKKKTQLHGPQKKPPEITSLAGESTILKPLELDDVAKKTSELREVPCYQNFSDFRVPSISQEYPMIFRQNLHVERLNL